MRLRGVLAAAQLTLKALASRAIEAAFNLSVGGSAMWASLHSKRYHIVMADLDSPCKNSSLRELLLALAFLLVHCLIGLVHERFEGTRLRPFVMRKAKTQS